MTLAGFPHSDISGSSPVSSSPELFAAYHVLHRLLAPRHPPCALRSLTFALSLASARASEEALSKHARRYSAAMWSRRL